LLDVKLADKPIGYCEVEDTALRILKRLTVPVVSGLHYSPEAMSIGDLG